MISQHLETAALFGLIVLIINWCAFRLHFYLLPSEDDHRVKIRFPWIGFSIYIFLFLFAAPAVIRLFFIFYAPLKSLLQSNQPLLIALVQVFSISLAAVFLIVFSLIQKGSAAKKIWMKERKPIKLFKDFGFGIFTWIISFPVIVFIDQIGELLVYLIFRAEPIEQLAVKYLRSSISSPYLLIVALFIIIIAAPILEEWFFRGFVQTYLKFKLGLKKGIVFSSLIFAFFHFSLSQGASNFSLLTTLFALALYLGFLFEKRQSLIAPIALHMTFNSISVMRIFLFSN